MKADRLVTWDQLALRLRGSKIEQMARALLRARRAPVTDLTLRFLEGELRVEGKVKTLLSVPFSLTIRRILHRDLTILVPFEEASAFGFLPIPRLLLMLAEGKVAKDGVQLDAANSTLIISLERFLPEFLDVEIEQISIVQGGISILLGGGGADPPGELGG